MEKPFRAWYVTGDEFIENWTTGPKPKVKDSASARSWALHYGTTRSGYKALGAYTYDDCIGWARMHPEEFQRWVVLYRLGLSPDPEGRPT